MSFLFIFLLQSQPSLGSKFGHYYDLTKTMDWAQVEKSPHTVVDLTTHCQDDKSKYVP